MRSLEKLKADLTEQAINDPAIADMVESIAKDYSEIYSLLAKLGISLEGEEINVNDFEVSKGDPELQAKYDELKKQYISRFFEGSGVPVEEYQEEDNEEDQEEETTFDDLFTTEEESEE